MKKIAIVGAGQVGQATAQILAREDFCASITLIGRDRDKAEGAARDIQHAIPLFDANAVIEASDDPAAMAGAGVVVITAGAPRRPGMSRADLIDVNRPIVERIVEEVVRHAPEAVIVVVTNPVDALTYHAWRASGWPPGRILGLSCVLDSARMVAAIARRTGHAPKEISALVIGGHGDQMLPLPRFSSIHGAPLSLFLSSREIEEVISETRGAGGEIVALKGTSGFVAAAASVVRMVEAVVNDRRHLLPCVAVLDGHYGLRDLALGVPTVLGGGGIVELPLDEGERAQLLRSAREVGAMLRPGA